MNHKLFIPTLIALICLLGACKFNLTQTFSYDNGDKYSAGDTQIDDTVKEIKVDWDCGNVDIVIGEDQVVTIVENTDDGINDDRRVHWWLDGTELHIMPCKSGAKVNGYNSRKNLTVSVPKDLYLEDLDIYTESANVAISGLKVKSADVDTTSGNISAYMPSEGAYDLNYMTSSGKVTIDLAKDLRQGVDQDHLDGEYDLQSRSGNIYIGLL